MIPIKFKKADAVLFAPPNWNEACFGICDELPIARSNGCIHSCWKPTLLERIKLILGQPVQMIVFTATTQPAIALTVGEP